MERKQEAKDDEWAPIGRGLSRPPPRGMAPEQDEKREVDAPVREEIKEEEKGQPSPIIDAADIKTENPAHGAYPCMDEDAWKADYRIDPEFKDYILYLERGRTKETLSEKTFQKFQQIEGFFLWDQDNGILRYKESMMER